MGASRDVAQEGLSRDGVAAPTYKAVMPARVFTIPASAPFLPTLIRALKDGRLIEGFPAAGDPLALAAATLFLPTQRAGQFARAAFLEVPGLFGLESVARIDDCGCRCASTSVFPPGAAQQSQIRAAPGAAAEAISATNLEPSSMTGKFSA